MKAEPLIKHFSLLLSVLSSLVTVSGLVLWALGLLTLKITLPLWAVVVLAVVPLWLYFAAMSMYYRATRKYKTGDVVALIADERKFMVVRYLFWFPRHVVLKEFSQNTGLAVNQKYVTAYVAPEGFASVLKFGPPNHNTFIPTVTITKL